LSCIIIQIEVKMSESSEQKKVRLSNLTKEKELKKLDKFVRKELNLVSYKGEDMTRSEMSKITNANNLSKADRMKGSVAAKRKRSAEDDVERQRLCSQPDVGLPNQAAGVPYIPIVPKNEIWECDGNVCELSCIVKLKGIDFSNTNNKVMLQWLMSHKLLVKACCDKCPDTTLEASFTDEDLRRVKLKCPKCFQLSYDEFWGNSQIDLVKQVALIFMIITGSRYKDVLNIITVGRECFRRYVRIVESICKFTNDSHRKEVKFKFAQIDETAIGKRKYNKGAKTCEEGQRWALTILQVSEPDPENGHIDSLYVDIRFIPSNTRSVVAMVDMVADCMQPGGTMYCDCWKAYPGISREVQCALKTVNHSVTFKDKDTGVHTNNVEGVHMHLKKDIRDQFGRQAKYNGGNVKFLDLAQWRVNQGLKAKSEKKKKNIWISFLGAFKAWSNDK
jgi:hypothetical protein